MFKYLASFALLTASATAAPVLDIRSASEGCGKSRTSGFNGPFTIKSGGRDRSYKVQVPSDYNSNKPYSLIFDFVCIPSLSSYAGIDTKSMFIKPRGYLMCSLYFHGRGGTPESQRTTSKYNDYSDASQYVIVYPQATVGSEGAAWQGAGYSNQDVDDVKFVSDLLNHFKTNYCIDTDHVYASGMSNGGGFVNVLACSDTGDQFAAFAMAAAALYADTSKSSCSKKRAILESHGDGDTTIPYEGGDGLGGSLPAIGDWVRYWGERNCGTGAPSSRSTKDQYHIQTFSCGDWVNVVTHYHLYEPAGHCWPSKGDCGNVDFTPAVLNFFGKWTLKNAPN